MENSNIYRWKAENKEGFNLINLIFVVGSNRDEIQTCCLPQGMIVISMRMRTQLVNESPL